MVTIWYFKNFFMFSINEIIKKFSIGFKDNDGQNTKENDFKEMKSQIDGKLREYFKLEFLNRIDEIVVFRALDKESLENIVDLEIAKVQIIKLMEYLLQNNSKENLENIVYKFIADLNDNFYKYDIELFVKKINNNYVVYFFYCDYIIFFRKSFLRILLLLV